MPSNASQDGRTGSSPERSKSTRRRLAGEDCVSAVVFGPNGSGKTVGLIIPNTLEWQGSVVMTTAKPQDLDPVLRARAALGPVWVVAPGGAPGVATASWSPVDYATDADAADRMAGWLVDSSGMTGDPRAQPVERAGPQVPQGTAARGPALRWRDAALRRVGVRRGAGQRPRQPGPQRARARRGPARVPQHLADPRGGQGLGPVHGLRAGRHLQPPRRAGLLEHGATSPRPTCSPRRPATLLLVTPQSEVERFTPYFTALISAIVHEAEQRAARTGGPVSPRLLLALDEAGNVFRYPRLPHLLTTARGNGVQLLLAYHDIAQIEHLFGGRDVARTILSNAKLRVLLPGVGDVETLRYFSELLGQTKVSVGSRQTGPDGAAVTQRSQTIAKRWRRCTCSSSCRPGRRSCSTRTCLPSRVRLRRWFEDRDLCD